MWWALRRVLGVCPLRGLGHKPQGADSFTIPAFHVGDSGPEGCGRWPKVVPLAGSRTRAQGLCPELPCRDAHFID